MNENLVQAIQAAAALRGVLLDANRGATAMEHLLLMPLIEQAEKLRAGIEALKAARNTRAGGGGGGGSSSTNVNTGGQ